MCIPLPQMMAEVEALACHRAVEFPKEIWLSEVILEGDAEVIIQQLGYYYWCLFIWSCD